MEGKWGKPPQQGQEPENQPTSADMPAPHSQPSRTPLKAAAGAAAPGTPAPRFGPRHLRPACSPRSIPLPNTFYLNYLFIGLSS